MVISWLPGQGTGFHDHGGSAGAFAVVWGTLLEWRVAGPVQAGPVLVRAVRAGGRGHSAPPHTHTTCTAWPPRRWRSACMPIPRRFLP
jgi:hypothetical protein